MRWAHKGGGEESEEEEEAAGGSRWNATEGRWSDVDAESEESEEEHEKSFPRIRISRLKGGSESLGRAV